MMLDVLRFRFAPDPMVYVSGNMFLYYGPGKAKGMSQTTASWYEVFPKGPRCLLRLGGGPGAGRRFRYTSPSTRGEDLHKKYLLYQDVLQISEIFLFDPKEEYLRPSLQGFRLHSGPTPPSNRSRAAYPARCWACTSSEGTFLRLHDPATDPGS